MLPQSGVRGIYEGVYLPYMCNIIYIVTDIGGYRMGRLPIHSEGTPYIGVDTYVII